MAAFLKQSKDFMADRRQRRLHFELYKQIMEGISPWTATK